MSKRSAAKIRIQAMLQAADGSQLKQKRAADVVDLIIDAAKEELAQEIAEQRQALELLAHETLGAFNRLNDILTQVVDTQGWLVREQALRAPIDRGVYPNETAALHRCPDEVSTSTPDIIEWGQSCDRCGWKAEKPQGEPTRKRCGCLEGSVCPECISYEHSRDYEAQQAEARNCFGCDNDPEYVESCGRCDGSGKALGE